MKILPDVRLLVNGVQISLRQTQALIAIASTNSQNQAARALGISVPVLHRYIKELEQKLGVELILTSPRGTVLTEHGKEIVNKYRRFEKRLKTSLTPIVACSPLYSHLVLQAVSAVERQGYKIDMLVGDDKLNNHFLDMGVVGAVVFDDPIHVYREKESYEEHEIVEVVKDTLIHVHKDRKYLRYRYGAQRIGFASLKLQGADYEIVGETRDFQQLVKSGHSFFINRSLALREGLDLKSHTRPKQLLHSIFALRVGKEEELEILLQRLGSVHEKVM